MSAKADELTALTTTLAALIEQDVITLKGKRPAALSQNEADRAQLMLLYGKAAAEFRNSAALSALPPATKLALKAANERLHSALKEHNRLLTRFRHVTEGLVKAIAETVAAREAPAVYARTGAFKAPAPTRMSSMTLNQSI